MFWADKLLQERTGNEWINDAWTPSGMVHMGGLKGPVLHQILFELVKEQGREAKYTYGFDDFDPIDGLPPELRATHEQYMGVPICNVPSPDGNGTFGEYFGNKMRSYFKTLGIEAEIYLASEYYRKGTYNDAIRFLLDNVEKVRRVYVEMYQKSMDDWYPLQVVCPNCGKLGTTKVTGWDGNEVSYVCEPNLVTWAKGCSQTGKISPFDGNAKLPWKVEWAAKWWTFKVTIEGAGKDHASAGGSYDIAHKICRDVFNQEPPLKLPYEFFLSGGKKMSSSKGIGLDAQQLLEVLTPQVARFLMIKTQPQTAVEFSPKDTDNIPRLYDDYQKAALAFAQKDEKTEEIARAFELSQIGEIEKVPTVRFSVLAQWVQMPNMQSEIEKGGLTKWATFVKVWVEKYAPEKERFMVQKELPEAAKNLSDKQKEYLAKIAELLTDDMSAEDLQTKIYELSKELDLPTKEGFAAIYTALLGKDHGPRAAWLIASLDKEFVKERFTLPV